MSVLNMFVLLCARRLSHHGGCDRRRQRRGASSPLATRRRTAMVTVRARAGRSLAESSRGTAALLIVRRFPSESQCTAAAPLFRLAGAVASPRFSLRQHVYRFCFSAYETTCGGTRSNLPFEPSLFMLQQQCRRFSLNNQNFFFRSVTKHLE